MGGLARVTKMFKKGNGFVVSRVAYLPRAEASIFSNPGLRPMINRDRRVIDHPIAHPAQP
jgi:hypothetical protein